MTKQTNCLPASAEDSIKIHVQLNLHSPRPNPLRIPAGERITLVLHNTSSERLAMAAGHNALPDEDGFEDNLFQLANLETAVVGRIEETHRPRVLLDPGDVGSMTFTLPLERRGHWQMAIFCPGRFSSGSHVDLTVE